MNTNQLTLTAAAVKLGNFYEKDGKQRRYDTITFILSDGDSLRLTVDGLTTPVKAGDICALSTKNILTSEGRSAVALSISGTQQTTSTPPTPSGK